MNATRDEPDWPPWVQTWILPYVEEATLWPVLFALLGHVAMLMAPMMLFVNRHGSVNSAVALIALALATAALIRFEVRYRRRPGGVTLSMVLTWGSAAAIAWLSDYYGVF